MASFYKAVNIVDVLQLADIVRNRKENVLLIDSRSFLEYNTCHVISAVNVCCSKIVKRRLQQDKVSVKDLLIHTCHCEVDESYDVVVYDQGSLSIESLPKDSFVDVLLNKLSVIFKSISLVNGGFLEFQAAYPNLCEDKTRKCVSLTSLSQPCLPISNQGPTKILPFMYLGSQHDALNKDQLKDHNITYELNVSATCPKSDFIQDSHFMRIPVNDNYNEKLLPHLPGAFQFLDKIQEGNSCVLVHCLAGISRSPTVAIAYVMRHLRMTSDDAYRYVKSKRATVSPNFNFLGQLLEYEKQLRWEKILDPKTEVSSAPPLYGKKRLCRTDRRKQRLSLHVTSPLKETENKCIALPKNNDQSPTTALAKLTFGDIKDEINAPDEMQQPWFGDFSKFRSRSCQGDWLISNEDSSVEYMSLRENNVCGTLTPLSPVKENKAEQLILDPSSLETVPNIHHSIYFKTDVQKTDKDYSKLDVMSNIKGIPVSSLKELNFTSCQASETNDNICGRISNESEVIRTAESLEKNANSEINPTPNMCCKLLKQENINKKMHVPVNLTKDTHKDFVHYKELFSGDSKNHSSKDSEAGLHPLNLKENVACAGYMISSNSDRHNSFQSGMKEDYRHVSKNNNDKPEKYSPSEMHLCKLQCDKNCLRKGHDTMQISCVLPGDDASLSCTEKSVHRQIVPPKKHFLQDLSNSQDFGNFQDTSKKELWPKQTEHKNYCQFSNDESSWLCLPKKVLLKGDTDFSRSCNCSKSVFQNKLEFLTRNTFKCNETNFTYHDLKLTDGLYRAQSCPGILSGFCQTSNLDMSTSAKTSFEECDFPYIRKSRASLSEKKQKYRNRYSFSNLDFLAYQQSSSISCESCPDVLQCVGCQHDQGSSSGKSSVTSSHEMFSRDINMIQVS